MQLQMMHGQHGGQPMLQFHLFQMGSVLACWHSERAKRKQNVLNSRGLLMLQQRRLSVRTVLHKRRHKPRRLLQLLLHRHRQRLTGFSKKPTPHNLPEKHSALQTERQRHNSLLISSWRSAGSCIGRGMLLKWQLQKLEQFKTLLRRMLTQPRK
jgi:hypothetical protein